jgi:hypothetical protein
MQHRRHRPVEKDVELPFNQFQSVFRYCILSDINLWCILRHATRIGIMTVQKRPRLGSASSDDLRQNCKRHLNFIHPSSSPSSPQYVEPSNSESWLIIRMKLLKLTGHGNEGTHNTVRMIATIFTPRTPTQRMGLTVIILKMGMEMCTCLNLPTTF